MSEFIKIKLRMSYYPNKEEQAKLLNEICEKFIEQDERPFNEGISVSKKSKKCEVYFEYGGYSTEDKLEEVLNYLEGIGVEEVTAILLNTQVGEELFYGISGKKIIRAESKKELKEFQKPGKKKVKSRLHTEHESLYQETDEDINMRMSVDAERITKNLGQTLFGKVWKTDRTSSGLIIKRAQFYWPSEFDHFDAILNDMTQIQRGDTVKIQTIGVRKEDGLIICELVDRNQNI